ncbi:MAG: hypothetical protein PHG67_04100 [Bacteroidales bacterium]|mgnify:CR=1 FL=1|jgi:hypothetical protein|nr:hypothetical protein [Bacteroidales bacterium]HOI32499.1 hypothetical protein [Bacteroidales bacterium]
MSADQLGLIALVILFASAYAFRKWYKNRPKTYKISEQFVGGWQFIIFDHNPRTEGSVIELRCVSINASEHKDFVFGMELIQKKRELHKLYLNAYPELRFEQKPLTDQKGVRFFVEKASLLHIIRNEELTLGRFRFFVKIGELQLIKSPEFSLSSKFLIFKPDTGKYN